MKIQKQSFCKSVEQEKKIKSTNESVIRVWIHLGIYCASFNESGHNAMEEQFKLWILFCIDLYLYEENVLFTRFELSLSLIYNKELKINNLPVSSTIDNW